MKRLSKKNHLRASFLELSALAFLALLMGPSVVRSIAAQTTGGRLQKADNVRKVQSKDSSNKPFFRVRLTIPEGIPKLKDPKNSIEILEGDRKYRPFYVQLGQETLGNPGGVSNISRFALLVIDVSGSMLERLATGQSKFEAAKDAAKQFLNGFQAGIDDVAVVSFESRQVASKVRQAVFASSLASVQAQIDNLPMPDRKGNTGLYTAIQSALEVLNQKKKEDVSRSAMLLVLTDGKNDVHPDKGDDPGLLQGERGLEEVAQAAQSSGFTVVTIGFGDREGSIDTGSLRRIASPDRYWSASNLQSLRQIFGEARQALINEFGLTFGTDWPDARSLTGRDIRFQVRMRTDDGRSIESDRIPFPTPQSAPPPFEGVLTRDEEEAWIKWKNDQPLSGAPGSTPPRTVPFEDVLLSRLMIMAGLGIGLAAFWFGLPRVMWPESYLRSVAAMYGRVPNIPGRPPVPGYIPSIRRPNIPPRPGMQSPPAKPGPDPGATMAESRVTIGPRPGGAGAPPGGVPKGPPKPRRPADQTMVTGEQPAGETDPWGFEPPDVPPKPPKR